MLHPIPSCRVMRIRRRFTPCSSDITCPTARHELSSSLNQQREYKRYRNTSQPYRSLRYSVAQQWTVVPNESRPSRLVEPPHDGIIRETINLDLCYVLSLGRRCSVFGVEWVLLLWARLGRRRNLLKLKLALGWAKVLHFLAESQYTLRCT